MAQHEYKCQSCLHRKMCPEYHPETYSCSFHIDEADVAPRAEVAREVFEEIANKQITIVDHVGTMGVVVLLKDIFELKKKYTEEK